MPGERAVTTPPLRIALVGFGKIAHDQHLPAIAQTPDCTLAAVVDPAAKEDVGVPVFASLAALLASDCAVDAVAICTPPQVRRKLALEAISAGKHVLLEKPPCAVLSEVAALEQAAQKTNVCLFAAWHSRFAAGVAPAKQWLAGREIRSVTIDWREDVRVWHPGQHWIWEAGGFGVFDPGINALSIATEILPRPLCVSGGLLRFPENCETPIAGSVTLEDSAGIPVSLTLDFLQTGPQTWDITVETDGGKLVLSKGGSVLTTPEGTQRAEDREYAAIYARFAEVVSAGRSEVDVAPLRLVADAFMRCRFERVAPFHE